MALILSKLSYVYKQNRATSFTLDIDLSVPLQSKLAILGPNGSGKSTLLKLIGGHLRPRSGVIVFENRDITEAPPQRRPTSTVFQDHALLPHLSVQGNIDFALRHKRGLSHSSAREETAKWIDRLELGAFADHYPEQLSVGYQQRVALARSLSVQPKILLLDEPSAALDLHQQQELILLMNKAIKQQWAEILIVVTHDLDLALSIADTVAVLRDGKLVALRSPASLYDAPDDIWLAKYTDSHNLLYGRLDHQGLFHCDGFTFELPATTARLVPEGDVCLLIRPSDVTLSDTFAADKSILGKVAARTFRGSEYQLIVTFGKATLRCLAARRGEFPPIGAEVIVQPDFSRSLLIRTNEVSSRDVNLHRQ